MTHHDVPEYSILQQLSCKKLKSLEIQKVAFGGKGQEQRKEVIRELRWKNFLRNRT
jgi:hypothetical protein